VAGFAEYVGNGGLASGLLDFSVPLPVGWEVDDIAFIVSEIGGTSGAAAPTGYTEHPASPVIVAPVPDSGTTRTVLQVFWRRLQAGDTDPILPGQSNHAIAIIHAFRGLPTTGDPWQTGAYGSAFSLTVDTTATLPGPGTAPTEDNAVVVMAVASPLDQSTPNFANWANANLANVSERSDDFSTGGNGGGVGVATGELATAADYGTGSVDLTPNSSSWAAITFALREGAGITAERDASGALDIGPISMPRGERMPHTDISALTGAGTANWGNTPDRVLWWNGYQSRWDAVVPLSVPPAADTSDWWIVGDAAGAVDAMELVDIRTGGRPTIVWDEAGKRLYVLIQGTIGTGGSLLYAYDYDDTGDSYTLDPSVAGISPGVNGTADNDNTALARTPNGYLWVASNHNNAGIRVNRSTNDGATWGVPFTLKATQADGKVGITYFANAGTTYVCIAAGEDGIFAVPGPAEFHFLRINQDATGWDVAANWTDETLPALPANTGADDEIQVARDSSENVYLTAETENLGGATGIQWFVYRRSPSGTWTEFTIRTWVGSGSSHKRPTMAIDDADGFLYVFANTANNTRIVYRAASLSSLGDLATAQEFTLFSDGGKGYRNAHPPEHGTAASDLLVLVDQQTNDFVARRLLPLPANSVNGSGAATLHSIEASGDGDVDTHGSGALTLPAINSSGTSGIPAAVNGSGALDLPRVALAASGDVDVSGTDSSALPAVNASGTATGAPLADIDGSGALTLPAIRVVSRSRPDPVQNIWTVDLLDNNGNLLATDTPVSSLSVTWSLDGPGSFQADVPEDLAGQWLFGERRVRIKREDAPEFQGVMVALEEDTQSADDLSRKDGPLLQASGLGLASVLGTMIVHGDFSDFLEIATNIAWDLIQHAQGQTDGNWGFTLGTVTGTAPARTKEYCDGDNIAEAIEELAAKDTGGFDWEIDADGAFNAWVGGRGTASGETLVRTDAQTWKVTGTAAELATYATALGEADEPCGPPLVTVSSALATTYKRREHAVDVSTTDSAEMTDAANNEMKARARSRLRVHATFPEELMPWAWGAVWLGDTLTVNPGAHFGGAQTMRVIEIKVYAEPPDFAWVEYELEVV
jgi:hypothetical protein